MVLEIFCSPIEESVRKERKRLNEWNDDQGVASYI